MPKPTSSLVSKLRIKEGKVAWIVNAPPGYIDLLSPLPEGAVISENVKGTYDFLQFFASRKSEIVKFLPANLKRARENAMVWIAYPKMTSGIASDLNRDLVRDIVAEFGWRTVAIISIDTVWAALRIRPEQEEKSA